MLIFAYFSILNLTFYRFHADHFNKLLGIMSTTGAFVTLLQFPLFVWESQSTSNVIWVIKNHI